MKQIDENNLKCYLSDAHSFKYAKVFHIHPLDVPTQRFASTSKIATE